MDYFLTHCPVCWNGSTSETITMCISGVFVISRLGENVVSGAQSAGNQRPMQLANASSLVGTSETTRATSFSPQFCQ